MHSPVKTLAGAAVALALCASPTMAAAATTSAIQPINPLVAVSAFGTQASAQTVYSQTASTASVAAAAVAAQDQPPPAEGGDFGVNWILVGLGAIFFIGGIVTLFNDGGGGDNAPSSPA
jgi:hypothetical protein